MNLKQNNIKIIISFLFLIVFYNSKGQDFSKIKNTIFFKFHKAYFNVTPFHWTPEPLPKINSNKSVKNIIEYHFVYSERNNIDNFFTQDTTVYRICEFYPNNLFKSDEQEVFYYKKDSLLHIFLNENDTIIYLLNNNYLPLYGIKNQDTSVIYKYKNNLIEKVIFSSNNNKDTILYQYKYRGDKLEIYTFYNKAPQSKFVYFLKDTSISENILFLDKDTSHYTGTYYYYEDNKLMYEIMRNYKNVILSTRNYIYDRQGKLSYVYKFSYNNCSMSSYYYDKYGNVNLIINKSPCSHYIDVEVQKYKYEYFTPLSHEK